MVWRRGRWCRCRRDINILITLTWTIGNMTEEERDQGAIYQETNTEPSARCDPPPPPRSVKLFSWNIKNNLICSLTACCHYCWEKLPVIIKKTGARWWKLRLPVMSSGRNYTCFKGTRKHRPGFFLPGLARIWGCKWNFVQDKASR